MEYILIVILCFFMFLIFQNINNLLFNEEKVEGKYKRLNKLRFSESKNPNQEEMRKIIEKTTNPLLFLVPSKYSESVSLKQKLEITGVINYLGPAQYIIVTFILKIIGILGFIFLYKKSMIEALFLLVVFVLAPGFLLNNEYVERKKKILAEFPTIIKSLSCFLNADLSFVDAIRNTLVYSTDTWSPYLKIFINDCEMYSQKVAITNICNKLDIFEIHDFFNMVLLGLEKGVNLKDSFKQQSDRMDALYRQSILDIIVKREMFATVIQAPMLLGVIIAFGLPLVSEFLNFTST